MNWAIGLALCAAFVLSKRQVNATEQADFVSAVASAQSKMVKVYGAGGFQRLEGHQSGLLVSPTGHILTAWSYVLSDADVTVVLWDGRRFEARLLGADPRTDIALLAIDYDGEALPHFVLGDAPDAPPGCRVLAFANIFRIANGDEQVSVQHGVVSAIAPLAARGGASPARFRGDVYIVDAITSNPGAAGGALTNLRGELIGMIGKELRAAESNTWLNYALPVASFAEIVQQMVDGKFVAPDASDEQARSKNPITLEALGLVLVPDVVQRTPPFVDAVRPSWPAADKGFRPNDLVVYIDDQLTPSCQAVREALSRIDRDLPVRFTLLRDGNLIEFTLEAME